MPFMNPLEVTEEGPKTWKLLGPIVYQGEDNQFTVPAGFETDFASVPAAFSWLVPPYGLYTKAAILHDYLYRTKVVSRRDADGIFRRAMRELGVSFLRRWLMWAAVRASGSFAGTSLGEFLLWLAIAIPAILFLAVPAIVVTAWLAAIWLVEFVVFACLKPMSRTEVHMPRFLLGADATRKKQ